jgi:hypothetical protein
MKTVYVAGGAIAIVAVAAYFLLGTNNNNSSLLSATGGGGNGNTNSTATTRSTVIPPVLGVKDISVKKSTDGDKADVQVTFTVKNPNNTTVILETIHYDVNVDGVRMTIGDVGQSAQGFLDSQSNLFPIVSGSTLTVRDTQTVDRNSAIAPAWDKMVAGNAQYTVTGTYGYRLTAADLQTTAADKDFSLTFR